MGTPKLPLGQAWTSPTLQRYQYPEPMLPILIDPSPGLCPRPPPSIYGILREKVY